MCALAGFLEARFRIRANGQTGYFTRHGYEYEGELAVLGEALMIKVPVGETREDKGDQAVRKVSTALLKRFVDGQRLAHRRPHRDDEVGSCQGAQCSVATPCTLR